jgi:hypothetical protein
MIFENGSDILIVVSMFAGIALAGYSADNSTAH